MISAEFLVIEKIIVASDSIQQFFETIDSLITDIANNLILLLPEIRKVM